MCQRILAYHADRQHEYHEYTLASNQTCAKNVAVEGNTNTEIHHGHVGETANYLDVMLEVWIISCESNSLVISILWILNVNGVWMFIFRFRWFITAYRYHLFKIVSTRMAHQQWDPPRRSSDKHVLLSTTGGDMGSTGNSRFCWEMEAVFKPQGSKFSKFVLIQCKTMYYTRWAPYQSWVGL